MSSVNAGSLLLATTILLQTHQKNIAYAQNSDSKSQLEGVNLQGQIPDIDFGEHRINLGEMWRGEKKRAQFEFKNTGNGILQIRSIHAACGCLDTKVEPSDTFKPGESGKVSFVFDSSHFAGAIIRTITVDTNTPSPSTTTLTITGRINQEIWTTPSILNLGNLVQGHKKEWSVEVFSQKDVEITKIESSSSLLEARLEKKNGKNLIFAQLNGNAPIGQFRERITVFNTAKHLKELIVPVIGEVSGHVSQSAQYLEFGVVDETQPSRRSLTFQSDKPDFKIENIDIELRKTLALKGVRDSDILKPSIQKTADGYLVQVEMKFPTELPADARAINASGTFVVRTNDDDYKTIKVPFFGVLKRGDEK